MITEKLATKKPINKRIFKFEYILVIILVILLCCLFFFNSGILNFGDNTADLSINNYETQMEEKLEKLLSEIDGAGSVKVMISVDGTAEKEYLKNTLSKTENGIKVLEETVVFVNGKPQLTKEKYPEVLGVVVICQGGENIKVKMAITEVVTTVLPVTSDNIRILKKK